MASSVVPSQMSLSSTILKTFPSCLDFILSAAVSFVFGIIELTTDDTYFISASANDSASPSCLSFLPKGLSIDSADLISSPVPIFTM